VFNVRVFSPLLMFWSLILFWKYDLILESDRKMDIM